MAKGKRLIVGLGNPGPEYRETRHNVGFKVADALADEAAVVLEHDGRAKALVGWGRLRGYPLGIAKPLTFMNRSGQAVAHLVRRYALAPADLLVVYDDINLPPGTLRLRARGGAGGHNGMQDVIDRLGTSAIPRLRVGIGSDFPRGGQVDYVLSPFSEEQKVPIEEALQRAVEAARHFVQEGIQTAMNQYN